MPDQAIHMGRKQSWLSNSIAMDDYFFFLNTMLMVPHIWPNQHLPASKKMTVSLSLVSIHFQCFKLDQPSHNMPTTYPHLEPSIFVLSTLILCYILESSWPSWFLLIHIASCVVVFLQIIMDFDIQTFIFNILKFI